MRTNLVVMAAAAFVLSSVAASPYVADASPSPTEMKKAAEIDDPAKANAAVSKYEAKDAKKQAHKAKKSAKVASHKAKVADKKADQAVKAATSPG